MTKEKELEHMNGKLHLNRGHNNINRPDGSKYTGEYVNDKREGTGTYEW